MLDLADFEASKIYNESEKAAIALAQELTLNPPKVSNEEEPLGVSSTTQARIKANFSDAEIVELVTGITVFNFMNRFNRFLNPDQDVESPPEALVALFTSH
ncbi:MAG: hypothetical protein JWP00_1712 [Chloroflexi bacterium]|jgi:alkylhydroperoxidase family enzyme|nr:hypothetical protein [Chloroflexota bacterium]